MVECECKGRHAPRRIVLTGGPGAGKTAVLELVRHHFCRHVDVLPESASILFVGGFRRGRSQGAQAAAQRAIFHVQRELEAAAEAETESAIVLCDRGTIDGFAYWPSAMGDFFEQVRVRREDELARYYAVLHLRTPSPGNGYDHSNPVRIETAAEARAIDERIALAWAGHPRRFFIDSTNNFLEKAHAALQLLRAEVPACCRGHELASVTATRD